MKKHSLIFSLFLMTGCVSQDIVFLDNPSFQYNDLRDLDYDGVIEARDECDNTLLGAFVNNDGCPDKRIESESVRLDIKFDNDSDKLKESSFVTLEKFGRFLNQQSDVIVSIEGHTSKVGDAKYNEALSLRRANAVKNALVEKFSVPEERINTQGYGEEQLIMQADTEEAHKMNRRVMATMTGENIKTNMRWHIFYNLN